MGEGAREGARGWWGREGGREGGRERAREGRYEAMMLGRQRASVEEGRVEEGNERVRDGTRQGQGMKEASGGGIERGGKLQARYPEEGTGQYTVYSRTIPQRGPCHIFKQGRTYRQNHCFTMLPCTIQSRIM